MDESPTIFVFPASFAAHSLLPTTPTTPAAVVNKLLAVPVVVLNTPSAPRASVLPTFRVNTAPAILPVLPPVRLIVFAGNMTLSNAFLQGVLFQT